MTSPSVSRAGQKGEGVRALLALGLGFLAGLGWRAVSVDTSHYGLAIADPVGTLWVNGIRMTVVPLVIGLIVTGITQSSDTRTVGRLGARSLVTFVALLSIVSVVTALLAPWVYSFLNPDPSATAALRESVAATVATPTEVPGIVTWITGLVPVNPVRAAVDSAMLPLLVFTVAFALACRLLPERERGTIVSLFRAISDAMLVIVRWVLWLAPVGISALALALGIRLGAGAAGSVAFYLAAHSGLLLVAIALMYVAAVTAGRVPLPVFARAAAPAQVVAMTTRSSMAALPAMLESAESVLRVPRALVGFVVPFAVSIFRMNQAVSWLAGGLFIARLYGLPFGPAAVATFAVACVAMSFSVPGIPSGSLFMIAPFFPLVGLPVEGVGILIALDTVPDVFKTSLNVTGHLAATAIVTSREREVAAPISG